MSKDVSVKNFSLQKVSSKSVEEGEGTIEMVKKGEKKSLGAIIVNISFTFLLLSSPLPSSPQSILFPGRSRSGWSLYHCFHHLYSFLSMSNGYVMVVLSSKGVPQGEAIKARGELFLAIVT